MARVNLGRNTWSVAAISSRLSPRRIPIPLAAAGVGFVVMAARVYVPTVTGLADQGDGHRMMCELGLMHDPADGPRPFFDYLDLHWVRGPLTTCAYWYPTSTTWLVRPVYWAYRAMTGRTDFNLAWEGLVWCLLFALACVLLALVARRVWRVGGTAVVLGAVFLVVGDSAFADYAVTPLSETGGILGILLMAAAVPLLVRPRLGVALVAGWLVFTAGCLLAVTSKAQGLTLIIPAFGALLLAAWVRARRTADGTAWYRRGLAFLAPLLLLAVVTPFAVGEYHADAALPLLPEINKGDVIFGAALVGSSNVDADLAELGLPASYARYAGGNCYDVPIVPCLTPRFAEDSANITQPRIAEFFVMHPDRLLNVLQGEAQYMFAPRAYPQGSYAKSAGHPARATDCRVCVVTDLLAPGRGSAGLALWLLLTSGMAEISRRGLSRGRNARYGTELAGFAVATALLCGLGAVEFGTTALGDTIEYGRHYAMAAFAFALALPFAGVTAALLATSRPQSYQGTDVPAQADLGGPEVGERRPDTELVGS